MSEDKTATLFPIDQYQIDDSIGYMLTRTKAIMSKYADESLLPFGITHTQAAILLMLSTGKHLTAADLSRESLTDAASMKRMIDRLVARNFIQRTPCQHDKRIIRLQLTTDGDQLAKQIPSIFCTVLQQYFVGFSAEEIGFLKSLLRRGIANNAIMPIERK